MDQELKAYLDEREARMEARMDEQFARMDGQFARMDGRFGSMDERLGSMDGRFGSMDERFARMEERFKQVETEVRHTGVLVERLDGNVRLLAEAVIGTGERIDSLRAETTGRLEEIKGTVGMIHQTLVPRVQCLEDRVKILEGRQERENRDVLEVLRERFGPRQA